MTTNPAFQRGRGALSSTRSAVSEPGSGSPSPGSAAELWPGKSGRSSGARYRAATVSPVYYGGIPSTTK